MVLCFSPKIAQKLVFDKQSNVHVFIPIIINLFGGEGVSLLCDKNLLLGKFLTFHMRHMFPAFNLIHQAIVKFWHSSINNFHRKLENIR